MPPAVAHEHCQALPAASLLVETQHSQSPPEENRCDVGTNSPPCTQILHCPPNPFPNFDSEEEVLTSTHSLWAELEPRHLDLLGKQPSHLLGNVPPLEAP